MSIDPRANQLLVHMSDNNSSILSLVIIVAITIFLLYEFFYTEIGLTLKSTGDNPDMSRAQGVDVNRNKVVGLAIASKRGMKRRFIRGVRKTDREYYRELLKTLDLGLEDRLSTKVGLLSGGQRQAVTLLMASMNKPKLLMLDEHTAALDPKTAAKVLEITDKIVTENHLTTLMITHNMRDAIAHGNRLIMLQDGHVVVDVEGEAKKKLTVEDLLKLFAQATGTMETSDKLLLS